MTNPECTFLSSLQISVYETLATPVGRSLRLRPVGVKSPDSRVSLIRHIKSHVNARSRRTLLHISFCKIIIIIH